MIGGAFTEPGDGTARTKEDGTARTKEDGTARTKEDGTARTKEDGTARTREDGTARTKEDGLTGIEEALTADKLLAPEDSVLCTELKKVSTLSSDILNSCKLVKGISK
jgi:hypothetical protein